MNTLKALELLDLPEQLSVYEGQVNTKINRKLVVTEINDFTQPVAGKPKKSYEWSIETTSEKFGTYIFNQVQMQNASFGLDFVSFSADKIKMHRPAFTSVAQLGQFAGQTYWHDAESFEITAQGNDLILSPYMNASSGRYKYVFDAVPAPPLGMPTEWSKAPINPALIGFRQKSIVKGTGGAIKTYTTKLLNRTFVRGQIEAMTGLTTEEIAYQVRATFVRTAVDNTTHITSMAMDIEQVGDLVKGILYLNGEKHTDINESGMITSYGKTWPGFIFDWRLYNDAPPAGTTTGASVLVRFGAQDDNTIRIMAGAADGYDSQSKTLIYNADNPNMAKLIAYVECLPAQGKNENVGRVFYPETGIESNWS